MPPQQYQETLAQMIRAKYPDAYEDMTDEALEAAIVAKFPEYKDVPRTKTSADRTAERAQKEAAHKATKVGGSGYAADAGLTYGDLETPAKQALGNAALDATLGYAGGGLVGAAGRRLGQFAMKAGARRLPTFEKVVKEEVGPLTDQFGNAIKRTWNEINVGPALKATGSSVMPTAIRTATQLAGGRPGGAVAALLSAVKPSPTTLVNLGSRMKQAAKPIQALLSGLGMTAAIEDLLRRGESDTR